MRKFISLMSAAAILASVAVIPITASAEDVFTYDDGDTNGWTTGDSHLLITQESDDFGEYVKIATDGSSTYTTSYALPSEAQLEDNYVIEYDIMYHQSNGMGRYGRYTQMAFISSDAEKDTNDFGTYATTLGSGNTSSETGQGYVTGVASSVTSIFGITSALVNYDGTAPVPSEDDTGMLSDVWYRVQTIVSEGAATMTVIDGQGNKIIDGVDYTSSASTLNSIFVTVGRGDAEITGGGVVALDNVRIYEGDGEDLTTDGLRRALETYTVTYTVDGEEYQTASVIEGNTVPSLPDVPEKEGFIGSWVLEDGTAFTTSTVITGDTTVYAQYAAKIEAVAKAAVLLEGDELRISDGTQGAVFRFEIADYIPAGEELASASLIVRAAPRAHDANNNRWANVEVWTYKVNSDWNGASTEIDGTAWNNLSKGDPINKQWTATYPDATGTAVAPYQTLQAIDVTSYINNGVGVFAFKTNNARTHAIDAYLTITTKEPGEPEPVETASPEPASEVEGSYLELAPSNDWSTDFGVVEGTASEVLNHSDANPVAAGDVNVYDNNVNYRGKSIYALYDVLVNAGDKLTLKLYNKTDLGTTFTLTGNADGTATATALVNKGDKAEVGNVVCGTWYRVLIEVPQVNNEGATNTGNATYTIYRINKADPTKVSEVAVAKAGLTPRNLSGKALTTLTFEADGNPYIDNGVAFVTAGGLSLIAEAPATPEPASEIEGSNIDLVPDGGRAVESAFAEVEGTSALVLNHSAAKPAVAGSINAYHEKQKGNSTYVAYDVLVNAGDKITLTEKNGSSVGASFTITGNENGTAKASGTANKGDAYSVSGNLVCGTWYRVVIETPITSDGKCGKSVYTVYRIDPTDPSKTLEVAAKAKGITPRNLSDRALQTIDVTIEGEPYIDNGVVYINPNSTDTTITWYKYSFTKDANGVLTGVTVATVEDPAAAAETLGDNEYLWDQDQTPYKAAE